MVFDNCRWILPASSNVTRANDTLQTVEYAARRNRPLHVRWGPCIDDFMKELRELLLMALQGAR